MMRDIFRILCVALLLALFIRPDCGLAAEPARPNILVILCDDLGWGDLENYGHPSIKTPNLMKMAAEGIQFSDFYSAAPVCSPSRVGLLTGRMPNRAGVYDWIPAANPNNVKNSRAFVEMRKEEFTIPRMLKQAGYATCMSGKWHCNAMFNSKEQAQPGDHGFDHWFATQNNAAPSHENPSNFVRNGEEVGKLEGFSCQLVADEFIGWLRTHQEENPKQPFFGYVAYHEPHEPVASPSDLVHRHEQGDARNRDEAHYFANVENLDAATGRLLKALKDLGYTENTLVIFTSDNGPETLNRYRSANRSYGTPGPLRGMKLHTHEAGYRVAGIMRWPKGIKPGQKSATPVCSLDFLPTFAQMAGTELPEDLILDGANFLPALSGGEILREKPLMWVYYHSYTGKKYVPSLSMRDGNLKVRALLEGFPSNAQVDQSNVDKVRAAKLIDFELYDLSKDPSEKMAIPLEESSLPERMREHYRAALETFHVWPVHQESK
ncbi:MAG: sulfatase-like hydrolase/transferase [Planctomycetota bacterium]|nr:sulfatase-like hydrolase/transferase [Planctomycetota bacterium]